MPRRTEHAALALAALLAWEASAQTPEATARSPALRVGGGAYLFGAEDARSIPSGSVVLTPAGERRVIAAGRGRPEIWKIAADGAVLDTGYFASTGVAGRIRVEWENGRPAELREASPGVPPWTPTGERFGAFRLTDWLVARGEPVGLPYFGRESVAFRFRPEGVLAASLKDGGEVAGTWRWSRGRLHLALEGFDDVAAYEWRALAAKLGWTQDMAAPALAGPAVNPSAPPPGSMVSDAGAAPPPRSLSGPAAACPRDVLARLLGSAAERTDIVAALAIEKETLALCAERQALVVEIVKLDRALAAELEEKKTGGEAARPARSVDQLAGAGPVAAVAPPPVEPKPPPPAPEIAAADGPAASPPPASPARAAPPRPNYAWFSLLGRPGRLLAGVTDGRRSWFVSVGDALPGGGRVERISGKPPGVAVAGLGLLPWTAGPGTVAAAAGAAPAGLPGTEGPAEFAQEDRPLEGSGRVLDGDTLDIAGVRVRLWGIDAPEKRQSCRAGGRGWSCGALAAAALRSRAIGLRCEGRGKDRYGRVLAVCFQGEEDVNAWMVAQGWALAWRRYSETYAPLEEEARRKGRGMHRGAFVPPWEWRRGKRLDEAAGNAGQADRSRIDQEAGKEESDGARAASPSPPTPPAPEDPRPAYPPLPGTGGGG